MTFTPGGPPYMPVGIPLRQGFPGMPTGLNNSMTLDAANRAVHMIGDMFWEDGGTHTIDTTGSSTLSWRCGGSFNFNNAGTTVKVGLADVDASNGPPFRAVNVSDVVTMDVSASFVGGGGGITGSAFQNSVPTAGSKSVAHGQRIAFVIQMTSRVTDSIIVELVSNAVSGNGDPGVTYFGSSYNGQDLLPNAIIRAADGTRGCILGGFVASTITQRQWNNTSGQREYGNLIQLPYDAQAYGLVFNGDPGNSLDANFYQDPLGTPAIPTGGTISIPNAQRGGTGARPYTKLFGTPILMPKNTPVVACWKPTTATNASLNYKTYAASAHQFSDGVGASCYAVSRGTSGAFAAQNSSLDRYAIGVLISPVVASGSPSFSAWIMG